MYRKEWINGYKKPVFIESVKLSWQTWSDVCDFVPKNQFVRGCFLNKKTHGSYQEYIEGAFHGRESEDILGLITTDSNGKERIYKELDIIYKKDNKLSDKEGNPF